MEERGVQNNYIFTLVKFVLFLLLFCFLVEISREFIAAVKSEGALRAQVLFFSILSCFAFYTFFSDLNSFYKKVQRFFFRSSFFSYLVPGLLILVGIGFFVLPKVFHLSVDKNIFLQTGGFLFTAHLIYVAREIKGATFPTFINYLFLFSILYIINLIIFGLYLKVGFSIPVGRVVFDGLQQGAVMIQTLFTQIFR
ncbi:MAG: hypothetical protein GF333_06875 [Candidatus Omnitrophica bacterium]|nr:hypothetical protein [Candidatus Omnitrophota bacterium]